MAVPLSSIGAPVEAQSRFGIGGAAPPVESVVRLTGGSMLGEALIPNLGILWAKRLGLPAARLEPVAPDEHVVVAEGAEASAKMRMPIKFTGTSPGFEPFVRGLYDFWMTVRQPREAEVEALRKKNVPNVPTVAALTAPGVESVVALDAVAVIAHPSNRVQSLTLGQMKDIFLGKITNWSQVGGANAPINIHAHDYTVNGTFEFLCDRLMGIPNAKKCAEAMPEPVGPRYISNEELADAVSGDPNGIGWVGLLARRGARAIRIDTGCGVQLEPDTFAVKSDEYPFSRTLNIYYHPGRPLPQPARDFLNFVLSPDGQSGLRGMGAIDLLPDVAAPGYVADRVEAAGNALDNGRTRIRRADIRAFEEATQGANRYSITFRFQPGTDAFDGRGEADLKRLSDRLKDAAYGSADVVLIGYSATQGDYNENRALSLSRADLVREKLTKMAVTRPIRSLGVGPAAPVACNTNESGTMSLNARVEVWIKSAAIKVGSLR
jgi:phosphate transport system substrate-binding protein